MSKDRRALYLTLEANSPHDLKVLMTQALYEIGKLLPLSPGAELEERNVHSTGMFFSMAATSSQTHRGETTGSLGSYHFEFVRGPADYAKLEQELLAQGYRRAADEKEDLFGFSGPDDVVYRHATLGSKQIVGSPASIVDHVSPSAA